METDNPFVRIKERLDLAALAGRYTHLKRAGSQGKLKGLCPVHTEKTPSFFVFPEQQRWHCFGCQQGGDAFDLVQAVEGWDSATALRELAEMAGVELTPLSPEQQALLDAQRETETILGVACRHWATQFAGSEGARYAAQRSWTAETSTAAHLGYYDGRQAQFQAALEAAGVTVSAPAAQAVLQTPARSLIYPHYDRGRVRYYAARGIDAKRHWNPPADLVGPRQPYYNPLYHRNATSIFIVEGQGDAVTLGQWGVPALALAGTAVAPDLVAHLRAHPHCTLGVDNDPAGWAAARGLAAHLGAFCRLVVWGEAAHYDANAWLCDGATAEDLHAKLDAAPTWLDLLVAEAVQAKPTEAQAALRAVFSVLTPLDPFALTRVQDKVCAALALSKSTFTALLHAARQESGGESPERSPYVINDGQICLRSYGRQGIESVTPLLNGTAEIVADIVQDDGQTQTRFLELVGATAAGVALPRIEVSAEDFAKMNWLLPAWGARVIMTAGNGVAQHLRAAIQTLSTAVESRHEYAHLGWRVIDGQPSYLTTNGALGRADVAVRLPVDLQRYRLPLTVDAAALPAAIQASLRFLGVGDRRITIPLLAALFLAPLSSSLPPALSVWLFGTTGSLKSTITALALCHFGRFSYNLPAPASWTSTTAYALRYKAFVCKDAPLWVDDYARQSTAAGENDLRKLAETLLREFGNQTGRSAGQADGSLRASHNPRGLVISTAEQLPPNPSIHPRLFAVEIHPGDISHGQHSPLTRAQNDDASLYPLAMAGYLLWLRERLPGLPEHLAARRETLTARARGATQHLRSPMNVATMYLGWEHYITYAHAHGVLDDAERDTWLATGWETLLAVGTAQDHSVNREEDPVRLYYEALRDMLLQGTVYLKHRYHTDDASLEKPLVGNRQSSALCLGWYDDVYWYLLDKPTFNAVMGFYRAGHTLFPDSARGIKVKLLECGRLHPDPSDTYRHRINLGHEQPWVLRITRQDE